MKSLLPLLLVVLALSVSDGSVHAQAQTRTPPTGYLAINLLPSLDGSRRVTTPLSYPLHGTTIYQGAISAISGNSLTLTNASLPDVTTTPYLVHVTSAANSAAVGRSFLITSSTATTVTATPSGFQLSSLLAANDQVLIYPANTLGTIFGASDSAVKLQGGSTYGDADLVYLWNGAAWDGYFYSPGTGWLQKGDSSATIRNNVVVLPDHAMLVSRISTNTLAASDIVVTGALPQNSQAISFAAPGTIFVANPLATSTTLGQLGLAGNAGWQDGPTAGDADVACVFQAGNWQTYFHITGYGWVLDSDPSYAVQDTLVIPPTAGLLVARQSTATSPVIQVPISYTTN